MNSSSPGGELHAASASNENISCTVYKNTYSIPKLSNYYTNHALIFALSDKISVVLSDADAEYLVNTLTQSQW